MDVDAGSRLGLHAEVLGGHLVHIEHGHANFLHHDMAVSRCAHRSVINHAIQNRGIRNQIRIVAVAAGLPISTLLAWMVIFCPFSPIASTPTTAFPSVIRCVDAGNSCKLRIKTGQQAVNFGIENVYGHFQRANLFDFPN